MRPLLGGIDAWRELNYPLESAARLAKPLTPITRVAQADGQHERGAAVKDKAGSGGALDEAA